MALVYVMYRTNRTSSRGETKLLELIAILDETCNTIVIVPSN